MLTDILGCVILRRYLRECLISFDLLYDVLLRLSVASGRHLIRVDLKFLHWSDNLEGVDDYDAVYREHHEAQHCEDYKDHEDVCSVNLLTLDDVERLCLHNGKHEENSKLCF